MPADDVSDLKDVFDAINRLCETMKSSTYNSEDDETPQYVECSDGLVSPREVTVRTVETHRAETGQVQDSDVKNLQVCEEPKESSRFVSAEDLSIQRMETQRQKWMDSQASLASSEVSVQRDTQQEERWSDTQTSPPSSEVSVARESCRAERWSDCLSATASPPGLAEDVETVTSDTEPAMPHCDATSEMYYTASSEISLLSDTELPEKQQDSIDKEEGKECVIAGHVAAMRERFESMTRANTPCPDAGRAGSPPLDVFRNITPSPDALG